MGLARKCFDGVALLWEAPLALLSFLFHAEIRWAAVKLGARAYRQHPADFARWRMLSREFLAEPQALLRYMVVAPRWNPHAVVASAGPFRVERRISLDAAALSASARYWTVSIRQFPAFAAEMHQSSLKPRPDGEPVTFVVPPGDYYIGARFYGCEESIGLPPVLVDGNPAAKPLLSPGSVNEIYRDLRARSNFFYLCLHYYVYVMVKRRRLLPERWVRRELLPVGNPETEFRFGTLLRGERFHLQLNPRTLAEHTVHFTAYSRASFPIRWFEIQEPDFVAPPAEEPCTYLVRMLCTKTGDAVRT